MRYLRLNIYFGDTYKLSLAQLFMFSYIAFRWKHSHEYIIDGKSYKFISLNNAIEELAVLYRDAPHAYTHLELIKQLENKGMIVYRRWRGRDMFSISKTVYDNWVTL